MWLHALANQRNGSMLVLCSGTVLNWLRSSSLPKSDGSSSIAILSGMSNEQFSLVMLRTGVLLPQEEL
jgi:hypothetical protein